MSKVFILDTKQRALDPVHSGWARKLLSTGQAAVWRRFPFTIILKKEVPEPVTQSLRLKLDLGSKRYRKRRVDNRKKWDGWLAPSLRSRVDNIETWVRRLLRVCPMLACGPCNSKKDTQDIGEFLRHDPTRVVRILAQAKAHLTDAACVGASTPQRLHMKDVVPLFISARGHGSRQMCRMDRFGFPRTGPKQAKRVKDFQTGDMVRTVVPAGKHQGTYIGRVTVRSTGSFNLTTTHGTIQGIRHHGCTILHRCDGYEYIHTRKERVSTPGTL